MGSAAAGAVPGVDPGAELMAVGMLAGVVAPQLGRLETAVAVGILEQLQQL